MFQAFLLQKSCTQQRNIHQNLFIERVQDGCSVFLYNGEQRVTIKRFINKKGGEIDEEM